LLIDNAGAVVPPGRTRDQALAHVRHALDRPDLPIALTIAVGNHQSSRVV
jgi:hypothetical protein